MNTESIPLIMDSIRKLLTYDFGSMFCCHTGYFQDGKKRLKQKLEYLENLCGEVKHLHQTGLSATEIRNKLSPKKYPFWRRMGFSTYFYLDRVRMIIVCRANVTLIERSFLRIGY